MNLVLILILLLVILYINKNNFIEMFDAYQTFQSFIPINAYKYPFNPLIKPLQMYDWFSYFIPESNGYTNLPWWNTRLGNTTNMSYDLRGDPLVIPRTNFIWNNSDISPINNQSPIL